MNNNVTNITDLIDLFKFGYPGETIDLIYLLLWFVFVIYPFLKWFILLIYRKVIK